MHEVKNKHTHKHRNAALLRPRRSPPRRTVVWVVVVRPEWSSENSCSVPCAAQAPRPGEGEPLSRGHRGAEAPGRADALTSRTHAWHVTPFPPRQPMCLNHGLARDDQAIMCGPRLRSLEASERIRYLAASDPSCGSPGSEGAARGAGAGPEPQRR